MLILPPPPPLGFAAASGGLGWEGGRKGRWEGGRLKERATGTPPSVVWNFSKVK